MDKISLDALKMGYGIAFNKTSRQIYSYK